MPFWQSVYHADLPDEDPPRKAVFMVAVLLACNADADGHVCYLGLEDIDRILRFTQPTARPAAYWLGRAGRLALADDYGYEMILTGGRT